MSLKTNTIEALTGETFNVAELSTFGGGGQVWKDALNNDVDGQGKRVSNVEYTNNTQKPIIIMLSGTVGITANEYYYINGMQGILVYTSASNSLFSLSVVIQPGGTFKIDATINSWFELRDK